MPVIGELLPRAEHRHCMRHFNNNFRKQFGGHNLKDKL